MVGIDGTPIGDAKGGFAMSPWEFGSSGWTNYFGYSSYLWGATLTPYVVKHSNFGLRLGCSTASDDAVAGVHIVLMKVYYTPLPNILCNVVTNI
jgi:hypothetical protein